MHVNCNQRKMQENWLQITVMEQRRLQCMRKCLIVMVIFATLQWVIVWKSC